jgi:hypothetical protein
MTSPHMVTEPTTTTQSQMCSDAWVLRLLSVFKCVHSVIVSHQRSPHQRADQWGNMGPPKSIVVNALKQWQPSCPKGELVFAPENLSRGQIFTITSGCRCWSNAA